MANEITLVASLAYADSEDADLLLSLDEVIKSITTKRYFRGKMSVTTSEVAIDLGAITSLGYGLFINRDTTNYIELRVATGSTKFARLDHTNGLCLFKFGSGVTAPFAIADSAACQMEYLLLSV